ncbi:adenylate/guanylate cyclase domain-containing protein [Bradyrhizobium sp. AUGA SZCCT0240]|uniref:adenylate/guanylate cyclase domain-containing protein n=1 Tax=unclassified Bradyrhizobium TaxID=2631580 RepID=UPI001BA9F154|nr:MULTISPECIES: adenylate/guanylate cyclase domain-containing protein [unclassified Bradyrhizobium]MBR1198950.1 adenylate/guanylate cyclase domain-containing protein [Bradyrhizobium sp. AUGA SZCCT0158]MBR1244434.1 adenylate/guanylate cyclase domain-containing protein [Bradyrhizobium sp. AUGA SZCCT0274]MBR1253355.1 adenylate/guanylate cyclase domain-containing protein [Bradyrhizobium sp. AUGA SZCCT0240]
MSETETLFAALRQSADETIVDMFERMVRDAPDHALNKMNALEIATKQDLDEERVIATLLNAVGLGMFEMTWNVMCPSCAGVLSANRSLKTLNSAQYNCAFCAAGYETTLDNLVEVTFTVSPRVRKIAAHSPDELSAAEYYRQIFWSSAIDLPGDVEKLLGEVTLEMVDLPPGERAILSLHAPEGTLIVFDPVTHAAQFIEVKGEETGERQNLSVMFNKVQVPVDTVALRPGPLRLALENRTDGRVLPAVWVANAALDAILTLRKPVLSATRLLTNQTFRDIYRTDTLAIGQRLKILSLTFLFSDLRGSTELYERVGDLTAFDLVNEHFRLLQEIIASERGAVVKTIGDAVMATFETPDRAIAAAIRMREAMSDLGAERQHQSLSLKMGIHEGSCLAVTLNAQQDYFGQTVNIASRVQGLAASRSIVVTEQVVENAKARSLLETKGLKPTPRSVALSGIADKVSVYEIS